MARQKPFQIFIYGTLMNPWVFRAVLGKRLVSASHQADGTESFYPRRAILNRYKKIRPDNTYQYAVPDEHGRISGYVVGPLPSDCLSLLLRYEGDNYQRRTLAVQTGQGDERALVFVGNLAKLQHAFGYEFRDHFKQEVILDEKIDAALLATEQQQLRTGELQARRAIAELRGATIRDLHRRHFEAGGISDYAIRHLLGDTPLPNYARITGDAEARALSNNYLRFAIRQVIVNQIEDRIHHDCRYELNRMDPGEIFYGRTFSLLAALRMVNRTADEVGALVQHGLATLHFETNDLVDFVRQAVIIAEKLYDPAPAQAEVDFIARHTGGGHTPLGAELEFSDIGHGVIRDPLGARHRDRRYDGFLYFYDFALDALTWKLGGHIDDHHDKAAPTPRRGFFEVALGSLSVQANISKPVTSDPWTLNQLIHETQRFYEVAPHSVHISLQLRSHQRPVADRPLPLAVLKCLFAIACEPTGGGDGPVVINRLVSDEIRQSQPHPTMMFSQITERHSRESDDSQALLGGRTQAGRYVQQFKFLRLSPRLNYEPILVALKGLQLHLRTGNFLVADQYPRVRRIRRLYDDLLAWGAHPQPLSLDEIEAFLGPIYKGLMTERRGKPAHSDAYIHWSLDQLREMLETFNASLAKIPGGKTPG